MYSGGGVQGPLRSNTRLEAAGSATISCISNHQEILEILMVLSKAVTQILQGPVGSFNQSGNGAVGG